MMNHLFAGRRGFRSSAAGILLLLALIPTFAADKAGGKEASLDGVWQGGIIDPNGSTHMRIEVTIKGETMTARKLDRGEESLGEGAYQITAGQPARLDAVRTS